MKPRGVSFAVKLLLAAIAGIGLWRGHHWYFERYHRFPLHRLPAWSVLEPWRQARTKRDVADAKSALAALVARYGRLPLVQPKREEQFTTTLGHELNGVRPGPNPFNSDAIVFWGLPAGQQLDGWGRRYHFYLDHDGDGVVHPPGRTVPERFVVWSDGPNGVDEGGYGDDLRSW